MNSIDACIVLGGGFKKDGSLAAASRQRVEYAAQEYTAGNIPMLLMSGAWNFLLPTPPEHTEAQAMAAYAQQLGVPAKKILCEEQSKDTLGNAYFTKTDFAEPKGWHTVRVITSTRLRPMCREQNTHSPKCMGQSMRCRLLDMAMRACCTTKKQKRWPYLSDGLTPLRQVTMPLYVNC